MATAAMAPSLRTVGIYSTSAGCEDVALGQVAGLLGCSSVADVMSITGGPHHRPAMEARSRTSRSWRQDIMTVPTSTIWDRDPHTAAKHQILDRYLAAWFPIMLHSTHWRSATYFDGFAGPGEYSQAEDGSPLIALKRLLDNPVLLAARCPVRFVFIEENQRRAEHLRQMIERRYPALQRPSHVTVDVYCGTCEATGISSQLRPSSIRPPAFGVRPPHCLKKKGTSTA